MSLLRKNDEKYEIYVFISPSPVHIHFEYRSDIIDPRVARLILYDDLRKDDADHDVSSTMIVPLRNHNQKRRLVEDEV